MTTSAELPIGTTIRGSRGRLRTVADGCGRNVERTHPQPPDPQSETGTLATHSGKIWLGPKNMYRSKKRAPRSKKHASRKRGREKHWETYYPKSKFGKYFDPCNSMMNDKFPIAIWDIWKQRKSRRHHSFTQVHPKWHK